MNDHLGAYLGVVVALWIASLGVPVPEDIALLTGGYLCYSGHANVVLMSLAGLFGVLSGDLFIFLMGRHWASDLLEHRLTRRLAGPERVEALKRQFHNHQLKTVFIGRFLPGMRTLVFLTAGAVKMSVWKFLLTNGVAALISVPFFVVLGYLFGHSFEQLKQHMGDVKHALIVVVAVAAVFGGLWLSISRSAKARAARRLIKNGADADNRRDSVVTHADVEPRVINHGVNADQSDKPPRRQERQE